MNLFIFQPGNQDHLAGQVVTCTHLVAGGVEAKLAARDVLKGNVAGKQLARQRRVSDSY